MLITPYEINSNIIIVEGLLQGREGTVEGYQKMFKELDNNGKFKLKGEEILEDQIPYLEFNNEIDVIYDGETLTISTKELNENSLIIPSSKRVFKFKEYIYNVNVVKEEQVVLFPHRIIHTKIK